MRRPRIVVIPNEHGFDKHYLCTFKSEAILAFKLKSSMTKTLSEHCKFERIASSGHIRCAEFCEQRT